MNVVPLAISALKDATTTRGVRLCAAGLLHALAHFGTVEAEDDLGFGPGPLQQNSSAAAATTRRRRLRDAGALAAADAALDDEREEVRHGGPMVVKLIVTR
jgi:hypothetical protein